MNPTPLFLHMRCCFRSLRFFWILAAILCLLVGSPRTGHAIGTIDESPAAIEARQVAFDLAGAFQNDAFRIRDSQWTGKLAGAQKETVIQVNLLAGNAYWFILGASIRDANVQIEVFNVRGERVTAERHVSPGRAAASLRATQSGLHYVRLQSLGDSSPTVCFLYCYK